MKKRRVEHGAAAREAALRAQVEELKRNLDQLSKWTDGLVTETRRLQGIEQRAEELTRERDEEAQMADALRDELDQAMQRPGSGA